MLFSFSCRCRYCRFCCLAVDNLLILAIFSCGYRKMRIIFKFTNGKYSKWLFLKQLNAYGETYSYTLHIIHCNMHCTRILIYLYMQRVAKGIYIKTLLWFNPFFLASLFDLVNTIETKTSCLSSSNPVAMARG